jgi:hypothetical protein
MSAWVPTFQLMASTAAGSKLSRDAASRFRKDTPDLLNGHAAVAAPMRHNNSTQAAAHPVFCLDDMLSDMLQTQPARGRS